MKRTNFRSATGSRAKHRGASILEFAFLLPVLLAILLGIIEFGWLVKNHLTMANATRDGARAASVGRVSSDVQARIISAVAPLKVTAPEGSISLQYSTDNGVTYINWPADAGGNNGVPPGNLLRVTTTTRHRALTGFFAFMANQNLVLSVSMRREP